MLDSGNKMQVCADRGFSQQKDGLIKAQELVQAFLNRTWYTHDVGLFISEFYALTLADMALNYHNIQIPVINDIESFLLYAAHVSFFQNQLSYRSRIALGKHMSVRRCRINNFKPYVLSDGVRVSPGQEVGTFNFMRNIPQLKKGDNLITHTRDLVDATSTSFEELADLCNQNDKRLKGINAFYGDSHLAGVFGKRFGFDIFNLNPATSFIENISGRITHTEYTARSGRWFELQRRFKTPKRAIISRDKLINLYG